MKLEIDLMNPQSVSAALALLQSYSGGVPSKAPNAAPAAATPPAPAPATPPAPAAPPASAPPPAAPPPPAAASPSSELRTQFAAAVQAFANKYQAKAAKQRFAEMSAAFGATTPWTKGQDVPDDKLADAMAWFAVG